MVRGLIWHRNLNQVALRQAFSVDWLDLELLPQVTIDDRVVCLKRHHALANEDEVICLLLPQGAEDREVASLRVEDEILAFCKELVGCLLTEWATHVRDDAVVEAALDQYLLSVSQRVLPQSLRLDLQDFSLFCEQLLLLLALVGLLGENIDAVACFLALNELVFLLLQLHKVAAPFVVHHFLERGRYDFSLDCLLRVCGGIVRRVHTCN